MSDTNNNEEMFAPRPTGKPAEELVLTGMLFAWDSERQVPLLLTMHGTTNLYLPCFKDKEALDAVMGKVYLDGYSIKQVDDGREFLNSLPRKDHDRDVKVVVNLRFVPNGRVRFSEVKWD